jgi:hypothetical protein
MSETKAELTIIKAPIDTAEPEPATSAGNGITVLAPRTDNSSGLPENSHIIALGTEGKRRHYTDARGQLVSLEVREEGDFLRAVAEAVLQLLMETDVEGLIGLAIGRQLPVPLKRWQQHRNNRLQTLRAQPVQSLPQRDQCLPDIGSITAMDLALHELDSRGSAFGRSSRIACFR